MFLGSSGGCGGNGERAFQCAACGTVVTYSDRFQAVGGTTRHHFVNPAGLECDFHTFYSCPGAVWLGEPTLMHTWFSGYGWSMAFCRTCGGHVGWHYQSASGKDRPREFWGILVSSITGTEGTARDGA